MVISNTLVTGLSALVLAMVFLVGGRFHPFQRLILDQSWVLSLGAGVSIAYVFVHMMPEMATAREAYAKSVKIPVLFRGILIYFVAMIGFMIYYGLDRLRSRVRIRNSNPSFELDYVIHIGGFALYVWMITYLLVNRLERTPILIGLYTVAMIAHFLTIDHVLREEHKSAYERGGRWIMGGMCGLGWMTGFFLPMPLYMLAVMVAFVSGAIIMNSAIMELPHKQEERFVAFVTAAILYGLLLVPLG